MKFHQYENGSCDIIFSKEEKEIISKSSKLHLPDTTLKHFGNVLVRIVAEFNMKFRKELRDLPTKEDTIIEGIEKKD
tara:strand:- start:210 stop:440 length:231 start_codon:yes stop_codon:yes gene_type:complete